MIPLKIGADVVVAMSDSIRSPNVRKYHHGHCGIDALFRDGLLDAEARDAVLARIRDFSVRRTTNTAETLSTELTLASPAPRVFEDEHPAIVRAMRESPAGTRIAVSAGAGSGKTTLIESTFVAMRICADGKRSKNVAVSSKVAGVIALRSRAGIPDNAAFTVHSIGLETLSDEFRRVYRHVDDEVEMPDASDLRIAPLSVRKHSSKYVIMLQVLMPPTANDGAQLVSLRYTINVSFVVQLADKMLLAGFGVTGYPSYYDQACQAVSHATRPGAGRMFRDVSQDSRRELRTFRACFAHVSRCFAVFRKIR